MATNVTQEQWKTDAKEIRERASNFITILQMTNSFLNSAVHILKGVYGSSSIQAETIQDEAEVEYASKNARTLSDAEMQAIQEEADLEYAIQNAGRFGTTMNPHIRDILKGFRYCRWYHDGKARSGRILRRNPKSVIVEPFDAEAGHYFSVGYGLIYDVEPSPPAGPTASDQLKQPLSTCTYVSFRSTSGELIKAKVIRRNDKTLSVLPVGETNPQKYWRVPYSLVTPCASKRTNQSSSKSKKERLDAIK